MALLLESITVQEPKIVTYSLMVMSKGGYFVQRGSDEGLIEGYAVKIRIRLLSPTELMSTIFLGQIRSVPGNLPLNQDMLICEIAAFGGFHASPRNAGSILPAVMAVNNVNEVSESICICMILKVVSTW